MLSVCMTTYNSEEYIKESLESALAQETSFEYEIVIVDDASTDNTYQILLEYQKQYGEKIKLFRNEKNLGLVLNNWKAFKLCHSKYIAILDSDDVWTDKNKIEIQVDFLENNTEFVMVYSNGLVKKDAQEPFGLFSKPLKENEFSIKGLLQNALIWNSSVVYRNLAEKVNMPVWVSNLKYNQDYTRHLLHARWGKIKFQDRVVGVYRIHGSNYSKIDKNRKSKIHQNSIFIAKNHKKEISKEHHYLLNIQLSRQYAILASLNSVKNGKLFYLFKSIFYALGGELKISRFKDLYYFAFKGSYY